MKRNIVIYLLSSLMLYVSAGCDYTFELKGFDTDPKLFVECLPGNMDTTLIKVFVARSVTEQKKEYDRSKIKVSISAGGRPVSITRVTEDTRTLRENWFYTLEQFAPGEELLITASLDGVGSVTSSTIVPDYFPDADINISELKDGTVDVSLDMHDTGTEAGYFGISINKRRCGIFMGTPVEYISNIVPEINADIPSSFQGKLDYLFYEGNMLLLWDTGPGQSGDIRYNAVISYQITMEDNTDDYKCTLYRMSPELYRYFSAWAVMDSSSPDGSMLTPPLYAFTNIAGGFGIFGGVTVTETEWFEAGKNYLLRSLPVQ